MDNKTYLYMAERVENYKKIQEKIGLINDRIEFYKDERNTKYFGQTNHNISAERFGKEFIKKLTEITLKALEEEKEFLQIKLEEI